MNPDLSTAAGIFVGGCCLGAVAYLAAALILVAWEYVAGIRGNKPPWGEDE